jgi:hypothetical protein
MPLLFGLVVGFFVFTGIWAFVGPFVALINFLMGRFFIASVLMTISLYSETLVWDNFHVGREEYKTLLILGLILEGVKWAIKLRLEWRKGRSEQGWEPIQTEVYGEQHASTESQQTLEMSVEEAARFAAYVAHSGGNVTVNVVDKPAMKDVTPRVPRWLLK